MRPLQILRVIKEIKASNPVMEEIFTQGSCFNLFMILNAMCIRAECYYSILDGHAVTMIDGTLYDINGIVKDRAGNYQPITEIWADKYKSFDDFCNGDMYLESNKALYLRVKTPLSTTDEDGEH